MLLAPRKAGINLFERLWRSEAVVVADVPVDLGRVFERGLQVLGTT